MYGFFLFCFRVEVSTSKSLQILLSKILKASMSRCRIQRNDSTESVNLTCQSARTVPLFCSNQFCPLCINTVLAIVAFSRYERTHPNLFSEASQAREIEIFCGLQTGRPSRFLQGLWAYSPSFPENLGFLALMTPT